MVRVFSDAAPQRLNKRDIGRRRSDRDPERDQHRPNAPSRRTGPVNKVLEAIAEVVRRVDTGLNRGVGSRETFVLDPCLYGRKHERTSDRTLGLHNLHCTKPLRGS